MTHFNSKQIAASFSESADTYDQAAVLQREIGDRLFERLDLIRVAPQCIADLGVGTGHFMRLLEKRYRKAHVYGIDRAYGMLRFAREKAPWFTREQFITADAAHLPFMEQSFDFIFSNLALHWCSDLKLVFQEIYRVLKPGGFFIFSTMGPDTLRELRESWRKVDNYSHVNTFLDMHHIGDLMLQTGWQDPVMDMEYLTLNYGDLSGLINDLRMLGVHNNFSGKRKTLTGKTRFKQMVEEYEILRIEGFLPATYEIVYGHAWRGTKDRLPAGEATVPVSQIRRI
jgi:malonyl-CoA O-methyltransferase